MNLINKASSLNRLKLVRAPLISDALRKQYTALMFKFERELPHDDRRVYYATVHWDRINHLCTNGYYDEQLRDEYV